MTISKLIDQIGLKALTKFDQREIDGVFVSDMLSDVMASAQSGNLWITVQTHKSVIPAANLVDVSAVIIASGKSVPEDTIELAEKHEIALLTTDLPVFELIGKLYSLGLVTK